MDPDTALDALAIPSALRRKAQRRRIWHASRRHDSQSDDGECDDEERHVQDAPGDFNGPSAVLEKVLQKDGTQR